MELVHVLSQVRSLADAANLLALLGHQPELPAGGSGEESVTWAGAGSLILARTGEFPWFGVTGSSSTRLARRVARRLVARGRTGGVIALDGASRRLAIAIAFGDTPTLALELDRPAGHAVAALERLGPCGDGGLAYAARAAAAVGGEGVGHRFFREFKGTLDRMSDGLPTRLRGDDRRSLALLQLTRVLFLYFVQAKGWLAGRERFLSEEVDRCLARRRHLHRHLLRPLFFGTLNRPAPARSRGARAFGGIPFLNGGLFEPHPLERALGDVPNPLWRDAFDRLFERFHFTVSERGDGSAVAPDMLGRVFEGVMAPGDRRASGTFYTPAALVATLVEAALVAHVAGRAGWSEGEAERRLRAHDTEATAALQNVTILDPAVGSGAFLLGALERLSTLTVAAQPPGAARRGVLQRHLFGVDRSATAVRLTELRLWLAVIADDPSERPEEIEPLPNLDCLIRQGDSLFEPVGGAVRLRAADRSAAEEVAALRHALVPASGDDKRALVRRLRAAESRAAEASLALAEQEARAAVRASLQASRAENLFGERRGLDPALRSELDRGRRELRGLRAARRALARDGELPWFQYQSQFADVFAAGGFDLVIGNPPWIRAEQLPADLRAALAGRYRWWRSAGNGFGHRPDLAVAFLERALELVRPGGIVAFLVPAKLAGAGYGAPARHALATGTTLLRLVDCTGRPGAEFDATVYPLALVARRSPPPTAHRVRTSLGPAEAAGPAVSQSRLRGGGAWLLTSDRVRGVLARMARAFPPLGERLRCQLGVKTGANRLFLDPPPSVEPELVRSALRGRDVRPFRVVPRVRLLWTHAPGGAPLPSLPPGAAAHLRPHHPVLRARVDYDGGPPWTLFRTRASSARHRVVWADVARQLTAAALTRPCDRDMVPLNSCYVAAVATGAEAERIAAWLNSSWLRALALVGALPAASGFRRFNAATVARLPLAPAALCDDALAEFARAGRRGEPVQGALDAHVARLLELAPRERAALARLLAGAAAPRG